MAGRSTPATMAVSASGVAHQIHEYTHDTGTASYGSEAALALGVATERVFKTLIVDVDGKPHVAVAPVANKVSLKLLAAAVDGKYAAMVEPAIAQRITGYVVGGISPFGQRQRLPTVIDETAILFDTIYVSAGRRGLEISLGATDLANITNGIFAPIAAK